MCRSQGLAVRRRCGWQRGSAEQPENVIWARRNARVSECPKSYITAASLAWIEEYQTGRAFGFSDVSGLPARTVDAFCVLELELAREKEHGEE